MSFIREEQIVQQNGISIKLTLSKSNELDGPGKAFDGVAEADMGATSKKKKRETVVQLSPVGLR